MAFEIKFNADVKKARKKLKFWQRDAIPKAIVRSLNRVGGPTLTSARKSVAKVTGFSAKEIKDRKYIAGKKANKSRFVYTITARRRAPNLYHFMTNSQRKRAGLARGLSSRNLKGKVFVRAKIMGKGAVPFQKAFVAQVDTNKGKRTIVLQRQGKSRLPLKAVFGPNISKVFSRKAVVKFMERRALGIWKKEFPRQLKFYVSRMK